MEESKNMPYALITGGSKGIGYAVANALAKYQYNLVLVARDIDDLIIAKNKVESRYPIHVEILSYDLVNEKTADEIYKWCEEKNLKIQFLCNAAGIGGAQDYLSATLEKMRFMVQLNVESTMAITMQLLPLLKRNNPSYILNVSSMAGFAPIPFKNLYSATKSAIIFYSYSLRYQLLKEQISVSCLCPGPVFTKPEIMEDTKEKLGWFGSIMAVKPEKVGEIAVKKTLDRKMIIVPGLLASVMSFFLRVLPIRLLVYLYYKFGMK